MAKLYPSHKIRRFAGGHLQPLFRRTTNPKVKPTMQINHNSFMKISSIMLTLSACTLILSGCATNSGKQQATGISQTPETSRSTSTPATKQATVYSHKQVSGQELTNEEISRLMNPNTSPEEKRRLIKKAPHTEGVTSGLGR